ncbi:MAG: TolC family protein [Desulfuromonadales bacterium]|nr:TolC family protein [Desulfuromonadales bacterium]
MEKVGGFRQIADGLIVPGRQNLAELTGMSEILVLADVNGQFVKTMTDHRIMEGDFASKVGETDLTESLRVGRSFNRESLAALARTEQEKAQTGQAKALLLPSVSVHLSSGEETSEPSAVVDETTGELSDSDTHRRTDASLTVRQPLFNLPVFLDWRRRKVKEQAREENYRASDGDAYISMVNIYLSLVSSRLQTDITRDFEAQLAELLSYIEKRADAGASSISDMARVRARRQETLAARLEQESAHAAAGIEFVRLTNLVPRKVRLPVLDDVGVALLPESFGMAVNTAIESNPEITALSAELEAAKIDRSVAKSRYLPRVDAEYTDTLSLHAGGDPSSDGQRDKRLMMVLNWELFSGGRDYKTHAERIARYQELLYRLDDQRRRVVQALSANYSTLAATRARIAAGYQELESISTAAEAMSKRMLSGNQSLLDLLTVYDGYYKVRSRLVDLHILEMNTVAQLVRLTIGTPWAVAEDTPEAEENRISPAFDEPLWDENSTFWDEGA